MGTSHIFVETPDGAAGELAAKVAALAQPASYREETDRVEPIETHMAWVFLTDSHAYKLKKPVRTAWFDHTTVAARHEACKKELFLNRRLAREVYLEVVPLVSVDGKLRVGKEGAIVDWLVKMRRLPRDHTLEARLEEGAPTRQEILAVAQKLSHFYETAQRAGFDKREYRRRIEEDIQQKQTSLAQPKYGLEDSDLAPLGAQLSRWLQENGKLLEARAGSVVDAHGDLRPEHIFLIEPAPAIIDCLEFDRSLRLLDPVSELSFLAMECRRRDQGWVGDELLGTYAAASGDNFAPELTGFYENYHALVRAAVAIWHLDDESTDDAGKWRKKATAYLRRP